MDSLLLIKFHDNYADEFDVDGFAVWSNSKWEKHKAEVIAWFDKRSKEMPARPEDRNDPDYYRKLRDYEEGISAEVYFGTNESVTYSSAEDYFRCFKITEISKEEHKTLKRLLGDKFGTFLSLEDRMSED